MNPSDRDVVGPLSDGAASGAPRPVRVPRRGNIDHDFARMVLWDLPWRGCFSGIAEVVAGAALAVAAAIAFWSCAEAWQAFLVGLALLGYTNLLHGLEGLVRHQMFTGLAHSTEAHIIRELLDDATIDPDDDATHLHAVREDLKRITVGMVVRWGLQIEAALGFIAVLALK